MKRNLKYSAAGMILIFGNLISACQPSAKPVQAAVIPVISSASGDENQPQNSGRIATPVPTRKVEPTLVFTPTPVPTRITRSTLPAIPPGDDLGDCLAQGNLAFEEQTLALVNLERGKKDLPPLLMDHLLVQSAREHSADMACHNYFNHYGVNGSSPFDRMRSAGYQMSYGGENIYAGPDENNTPAVAVRLWMNSSTHRNAILNPNYTEAGVGYYFYKPATYDGYFTIDFAAPASMAKEIQEEP